MDSQGFVRDVLLNRHADERNEFGVRAGLDISPSASFSTLTFFNYSRSRNGGSGGKLVGVNPASAFNAPATRAALGYADLLEVVLARAQALGPYKTESGLIGFNNTTIWSVDNTTTFKLSDSFSMKNILGYRDLETNYVDDYDGTPYPILPIETEVNQHQISEELQFSGSLDWVDFIVGGYYFREHGLSINGISVTGGRDFGVLESNDIRATYTNWSLSGAYVTNTSYAVFAQGTFKLGSLVEGLSLTVGARQNWDKRAATIISQTPTTCRFTVHDDNNPATPEVRPALAQCALPVSTKFSEPTYNISLEYKLNQDKLIYLAHRHGYRTGGFSLRSSTQLLLSTPFKPETVDDVELGLKADWRFGDSFLRTNFAAFISDFKDIQRVQLNPNTIPLQNVTTNAAKARIKGFEAEVTFRPIQPLTFSAFYSYTDARYKKFIALTGADLSGRPFAFAPKNQYGASARLDLRTSEQVGGVSLGVNFTHADSYSDFDETDIFSFIHGHSLVDADVSWTSALGTGLDVKFFVTNLFDKVHYMPLFHSVPLGTAARVPGQPRSVGVKARYRF